MNPMFEQIEIGSNKSLKLKRYVISSLDIPYHYHPEIEIVLVIKSSGNVFVRNSMTHFKPGDVFIFGTNVPHLLVNEQSHYQNENNDVELLVIQFNSTLFNSRLTELAELSQIQRLLTLAHSGLRFHNKLNTDITKHLFELEELSGVELLMKSILLLEKLYLESKFEVIDKLSDQPDQFEVPDRIQKVTRYILNNYNSDITLDEVSKVANMNKTSFCRYFKEHTRKTFSEYINELRIDYACKLLIEGSFTVSYICYEAGYNNLTYFIRQFKKIQKMTPRQYQQRYQQVR